MEVLCRGVVWRCCVEVLCGGVVCRYFVIWVWLIFCFLNISVSMIDLATSMSLKTEHSCLLQEYLHSVAGFHSGVWRGSFPPLAPFLPPPS